MKTNPSILPAAAALLAGIISIYAVETASAQVIDPVTGLPSSGTANGSHIDAATGLPATQPGELTPEAAVMAPYQVDQDVKKLIFNSQYEKALQRCLEYHDRYKTSGSLIPLLSDWVELGRRYPKAKEALIGIRDHDAGEFSEGRGYFELFSEINAINGALQQGDATYDLFKSFRDKDPALAQQCYSFVEGLLVSKGEYQWCYDHMGDAEGKLEASRQNLAMQLENQKRMAEMSHQNAQRITEMQRQRGMTNSWSPPDTTGMMKKSAEDGFIGQTRLLIEILVATNHKVEAEKIRDGAMVTLDDSRVQSAVSDAEQKLKK